ncbi:MAG: HD-GYP domain-containing protein [Gammaproteobacteria bacterium]|nr:HD-GYP domain-containing protein [Gammaproteobacteria bacterium]
MPKLRIPIAELQVGMYIELDLGWNDHPFLFSAFKLKQDKQIRILRGLGLTEITVDPDRSDVPVRVAPPPQAPGPDESELQENPAVVEKAERMAQLKQRREGMARCEKSYRKSMEAVKNLMKNLGSRPIQAVEEAEILINDMVKTMLGEGDVVLHLMNEKAQDESSYYHMLNVSVLGMMLARHAGMPAEDIKDVGMGALFHDIGKQKIPSQILRKKEPLNRAEQAFFEQHPQYGRDMAETLPTLSANARDIIGQHHEAQNGTGYPKGLQGAQINRLAGLIAIVNAYDNLVNPLDPEHALTPHEALSVLFKERQAQFNPELLALFVKNMGVFPPGTVVQLSNAAIGMVISINPSALLHPRVLLYNPEVPKTEAIIFDLADDKDVVITASLRPGKLAPEVYDYLSPRTRISYYMDKDPQKK